MKTLKYLIAIFIFLGSLELFCRIDDYFQWEVGMLSISSPNYLTTIDDLGKRGRPNAVFQRWRLNSQGFHNDFEVEINKPFGCKRIFILGASESFGLYESDGMDYPSQLRDLLEDRGFKNIQVINASSPGMSLPYVQEYYEKFISRFNPDLIIYYPSPSFYLHEEPPFVKTEQNSGKENVFEMRLMAKTRILMKKFLPDSIKEQRLRWMIGKEIARNGPDWVWKVAPRDRLKLFEEDLREFCDSLEKDGTKIILATHASTIGAEDLSFDIQQYLNWRRYYPRAGYYCLLDFEKKSNSIIKTIGMDMRIQVLDIEKTIPRTKDYFSDYVHFTDNGSEIVANLAADAVLSKMTENKNTLSECNPVKEKNSGKMLEMKYSEQKFEKIM